MSTIKPSEFTDEVLNVWPIADANVASGEGCMVASLYCDSLEYTLHMRLSE